MAVHTWMRLVTTLLAAAATFGVMLLLAGIPVPPEPRLGRQGAERRRALATRGWFRALEPLLRFLAGIIAFFPLDRLRERQALELKRADHFLGLTPDELSALSVLSAVGFGSVVGGACLATGVNPLLIVPTTVFGFFAPKVQLDEITRARVKQISRTLPHAIEITALCMGAGVDFPGALRLVSTGGGGERGPLEREFSAILDELELGRTRREALLGFAERVPSEAVRDFVSAVVQAEQKGNPLAQVIQIQGRMLSNRRSVAAEEAAARAGVLMIGPTTLLLGSVLLLLMGPFCVNGVGGQP
jgi:tight adherence protein C